MALQQNNVTYLDDWNDLKEYTKKKAAAVEKEKDNRDVTKDYVGEQIDGYAQEDAAREAADISALYKKIEDISAGGGVDLTPYLKKDDAAQIYATKSEIPSVDDYVTQEQMTEALEDKATIAQVAAVDQKVDAIVIPDTSNFATKADVSALAEQIPSVDGFVTEEQMTAALEDKATIAQVAAVDQKVDAIVIPDTSNFATKAELNAVAEQIPSVDDFVTEEQMTAALADKATIAQVAAVDQKVDAIVIPDTSNFATKAELNAVAEQIPSVEGFVTEEQLTAALEDKATIAQVATVDQKVDAIDSSLEQKATYTYVNEELTQLEENIGNALDEKADANDVSAAFESVESSIETKADAETVPTKTEFEALKAKFDALQQLVYEYAPGSEEEAMADGEIADLSPSNKNINIETEMVSIEVPATTTLYTVAAPLRNNSTVELTSDYSFSFDNMSEEPVNTTFKRETAAGETKVSGTTVNLSGVFNDVVLENISIAARSGKDPATFANTNEKELSINAQILDGATIKNDSDKQITITNRTDQGSEVILVAPNSTVVLNGGTFTTLTTETADNTLIVNQNTNIDKLILKKGNVCVKDFDVSARIGEIEDQSAGEYNVYPYEVEVSDASKFASTITSASGVVNVTDDLDGVRAAGYSIFANNRVKVNLNNHTVSGGNNNYVVYTRGSAVVEFWDGTIDSTAKGYAIWCQGGTVNLHNVHVIGCEHAIYLSNAAGEINVYGGRLEVNGDSESTNYVVNYLDSVYASGCRAIHLYENVECVDYDPSNAPSESGHPSLLMPGYHVESYAEGVHTIYKVVKDSE